MPSIGVILICCSYFYLGHVLCYYCQSDSFPCLSPGCNRRMDVVFVLDASGSAESMFYMIQQTAKRITDGLNFDGNHKAMHTSQSVQDCFIL